MKTLGFQGFIWRRGWDSNPCAIARKLISSQPRYDHFDTSPYMLTRHTEINAIFSCIRIPVRTGGVLETMECPKPAWLKGFRRFDFRLAKKISSQPRYDHFDISPYLVVFEFCTAFARPELKCIHPKFKKNEAFARKSKNTRAFASCRVISSATFRVSPVMTTSIRLRIVI